MKVRYSLVCVAMLAMTSAAFGQDSNSASKSNGSSIEELIANVAKQTGKKFILDPRVRAEATLIGIDRSKLDYPLLLTVLELHGFAAVELGGVVRVVPDAGVRTMPVPTVVGNKQYPDSEVVSKVFILKSAPAAMLVPMLRPMVAQAAHLASMPCLNSLVIVDRFANVQRIGSVIETLDKGEPFKAPPCVLPDVK